MEGEKNNIKNRLYIVKNIVKRKKPANLSCLNMPRDTSKEQQNYAKKRKDYKTKGKCMICRE